MRAHDRWLYRRGSVEERELQCPACCHEWFVDGREEYGRWEPTCEGDLYCPECGVEGDA